MGYSDEEPWVQVVGRVAIHRVHEDPFELHGSTAVLLSVLVAGGASGVSIDEIAEAYWPTERPPSWRIALRAARGLLQTRLPAGWRIVRSGDRAHLVPGSGWIDTWRVEQEAPHEIRPTWLATGPPFPNVENIPVVDAAAERFARLVPAGPHLAGLTEQAVATVQSAQRLVVLGVHRPGKPLIRPALTTDRQDTLVVGDRGLAMPLGPYAMAFPELREAQSTDGPSVADRHTLNRACLTVLESIKAKAETFPQRVLVSLTNELDEASLELTALLVERTLLDDFVMIMCADRADDGAAWLACYQRLRTAGCQVLDLTNLRP